MLNVDYTRCDTYAFEYKVWGHKNPGDHNKDWDQRMHAMGEEEKDVNLLFIQLVEKCYYCVKAEQKSLSCREKNKPKEEWAINKDQPSHAQAQATGNIRHEYGYLCHF